VTLLNWQKQQLGLLTVMDRYFSTKKSTRAKLATHRLKQVLPASGLGCVLEVEGLVERFKSLQVPKPEEQYCGILSYGYSNLLYGYYTEPIKTTWRMV